MNFKFIAKDAVNVIGEKDRQVFLVSDWTGEDGPHYYPDSNLPNGTPAVEFVAEKIRRPGGDPGLSADDPDQLLPLAKEFLRKAIPPAVSAFITVTVEERMRELKHADQRVTVIGERIVGMRSPASLPYEGQLVDKNLGTL
jgi:hypothetical protein